MDLQTSQAQLSHFQALFQKAEATLKSNEGSHKIHVDQLQTQLMKLKQSQAHFIED
jgi:hypothetical protein